MTKKHKKALQRSFLTINTKNWPIESVNKLKAQQTLIKKSK